MSGEEKTYRTAAFLTNKPGYLYRFWVLSPAYGKPGYQIKEHEKGITSGAMTRIADALPEREAFAMLKELEAGADRTLRRVTHENDLRELGPDYKAAEYFADHNNTLTADIIHDRLKKRRPTNLRLKP